MVSCKLVISISHFRNTSTPTLFSRLFIQHCSANSHRHNDHPHGLHHHRYHHHCVLCVFVYLIILVTNHNKLLHHHSENVRPRSKTIISSAWRNHSRFRPCRPPPRIMLARVFLFALHRRIPLYAVLQPTSYPLCSPSNTTCLQTTNDTDRAHRSLDQHSTV